MSEKDRTYVIAYHSFGIVHTKFCYALSRLAACSAGKLVGLIEMCGPYTEQCRNDIATAFLDKASAPYLMMIDADIQFGPEAVEKTIEVAEETGAGVVWGNYALGLVSHSLFAKNPLTDEGKVLKVLEPNQIIEDVYAGGTGWCLMKREALEKLRAEHGDTWFDRVRVPGTEKPIVLLGEDLAFGRRCWYAGVKQVGFTGIKLVHHKTHATVPSFMKEEFEQLEVTGGK